MKKILTFVLISALLLGGSATAVSLKASAESSPAEQSEAVAEKQHKLNCLRNSSSESICLRI